MPKRIWERSISKTKVRYTAFYGDRDSKSYLSVQGTYPWKSEQKDDKNEEKYFNSYEAKLESTLRFDTILYNFLLLYIRKYLIYVVT